MLALSTHDTKRSEDVRARLAVLSEVPGAWGELARRWSTTLLEPHRGVGGGVADWPDLRMEYLLLQTLVGAHPLTTERVVEYMGKATKEAKRNTSWTRPQSDYDRAVEAFVESVMADGGAMAEVAAFVESIIDAGRVNSLSQKLITLTAPGVPDLYQGSELWDLSLVDPDNRRPVDFDVRRRLLTELDQLTIDEVMARSDEGLSKLWLVSRTLRLRQRHPELFANSSYEPVLAEGRSASHLFGFVRAGRVITLATRLPLGLDAAGGWADTTIDLAPGLWTNALATEPDVYEGGLVEVGEILKQAPVALLHDVALELDEEPATGGTR